jgi:hypothetical protein
VKLRSLRVRLTPDTFRGWLSIAGLSCLDIAAFMWLVPVGFVAVGLSLLFLDLMLERAQ